MEWKIQAFASQKGGLLSHTHSCGRQIFIRHGFPSKVLGSYAHTIQLISVTIEPRSIGYKSIAIDSLDHSVCAPRLRMYDRPDPARHAINKPIYQLLTDSPPRFLCGLDQSTNRI